jgi:O-antigen/teichoic acid export membrane protein
MIKDRLKPLLKDSVVYGITGGIAKFFALITLPLVVNQLSSTDYGAYSMIQILFTVSASVLVFGMDSAVVFCLDDFATASLESKKVIFTNAIFFQMILSLFSVLFLFLNCEFILHFISLGKEYTASYQWSVASLPLVVFFLYIQNWFKWTFKKTDYLIQILGYTLLNLFGLFIFTTFYKLTVCNVICINFWSLFIIAIAGAYRSRAYFYFHLDLKLIWKLTKFGFPMMLVMLLGVLLSSIDRFFLSKHVSNAEIGIYSFGQRISLITVMFVTAFQIAFGPFLVSIWNHEDAAKTFAKFQTYYIILVGTFALAICSLSKIIILVINPNYMTSIQILPFLISGAFIYGLYSFSGIGVYYSKKSHLNLYVLAISFTSICLFDMIFTKFFPIYAVCAGFLIGNIILVATGYLFSRKYYTIHYNFKVDIFLVFSFFGLVFLNYFPFHPSIVIDSIIHTVLTTAVFIVVCFLLLSKKERSVIVYYLIQVPSLIFNPKKLGHLLKK